MEEYVMGVLGHLMVQGNIRQQYQTVDIPFRCYRWLSTAQ